ncbi:Protein of unknown function [Cotesia congregata]|uniref:Uncharacterized protein n=1 Tax=Cotesia congregata TaxID=51543 RepID=A0A8J2HBH6_COTCN|nr:Protein of unknown function [Cotesia congregata]
MDPEHFTRPCTQIDQSLYCDECKLEINCSTNKQLGNVFLYLSLKYQLQHFCEHHHEFCHTPFVGKKNVLMP